MIGYRVTMPNGRMVWTTNHSMYSEAVKIIRCETVLVPEVEAGMSGYLDVLGRDAYTVTAGAVPVDNVENGEIVATARWGLLIRKSFEWDSTPHHIVVPRNWFLTVPVGGVL